MQIENNQPPAEQEMQCVMRKPKHPIVHEAIEASIVVKGIHLKLPSRLIFAADDGSVYVIEGNGIGGMTYTSLEAFISAAKTAESFSGKPK